MNRRTFIASLVAIPAGVAAAVKIASAPEPWKPKLSEAQKWIYWSTPTGNDNWIYRNFAASPHYDFMCGPEAARVIQESFDKYYEKKYGFDYKAYRTADTKRWVDYLNQKHGEELYAGMRALTG